MVLEEEVAGSEEDATRPGLDFLAFEGGGGAEPSREAITYRSRRAVSREKSERRSKNV